MHSPSGDAYDLGVSRILVADDDTTVRAVVADYLAAAGHESVVRGDGPGVLERVLAGDIDLVVLDLMMPGMDGLEVLRRMRAAELDIPVIILTAKDGESDRILGLELGADDYLTKPFSPRELVLRIEAILRRGTVRAVEREVLQDGDLTIDPVARKAFRDGRELDLTLREFDLLAYFLAHPNQVLSRDDLLAAVWGWQIGDASTVTVHVRRLRGKLEADPAHPTRLVTVWGRGYRWEACA